MECKAAIFDMDGLLFDSEHLYQELWHELADEYGVELPDSFVYDITGTSGEKMDRVLEQYYPVKNGRPLATECKERLKRRMEKHVPILPGVVEMLEFLKGRGIQMAVASSSNPDQIKANLEHSGLKGYFETAVSGFDIKNSKPAPDIFLEAAKRLHVDPKDCILFEDSENGIIAGKRAGMKTVMIPCLFQPGKEVRKDIDILAGSMTEVLDLFKEKTGDVSPV